MRPLLAPIEGATGIDPLPADAATTIRRALVGRHIEGTVLVVADGCIEVEDRDQRAALLRRAGVYAVARAIRRIAVPAGHICVYTDSERGTGLCTVALAELLALAEDVGPTGLSIRALPHTPSNLPTPTKD